jgi:hydroxypyruvate reductase
MIGKVTMSQNDQQVGSAMHAPAVASLSKIAKRIFLDSLAACSVPEAFRSLFAGYREADHATSLGQDGEINLATVRRLLVVAAGKGAGTMLQALLRELHLPPACEIEGILIAPERPDGIPQEIQFFAGGHPLPSAESRAAATAALSRLQRAATSARAGEIFCFYLFSGGASAMMELPLDRSISVEDTRAFHQALIHSGASITEVNCIRKHFSAVKGGRLGLAAQALPSMTLLVSDVPAGHLDALGSGPTLPDPSTVAQCRAALDKYHLLPQFPASIREFFESDRLVETPKPGGLRSRVHTLLSAENLAEAARAQAESLGFTTLVDNSCDDWDFELAADYLLSKIRTLREAHGRVCLISVGEVTVRVPSRNGPGGVEDRVIGVGGRNQQFALYVATLLRESDRKMVLLSAGSDGVDGDSPAAGAIVDCETLKGVQGHDAGESASELRSAAQDALFRFDSYAFLKLLDATVEIGPTGNNLRDLRIFLAE